MITGKRTFVVTFAVCALALATVATSQAVAQVTYTTKLTSGPFFVAPTAVSVDWVLLNNDTVPVNVHVTVYNWILGEPKVVVAPGPFTLTLPPGQALHNANSVGSVFHLGFIYEVVVEATSDRVHPNVNQWSCMGADCFIPGSLIPAGDFVEIKQPKPPKP